MRETEQAERAGLHAEEAELLIGLKRYPEALAACSRAIAQDPEDAGNYFDLARIHLLLEQDRDAQEAAQQAITLAPEWPYGFYIMSVCLHRRLDFDGELRAAAHAVSLDPENPLLLERLVRAQMQSGQLKKARTTAAELVKVSPEDADTHSLLSDICFELSDYRCAETHLREALRQTPENHVLHNDLGRIALARKRWREAIDAFHHAVKLQPDAATYHNNLNLAISYWLDSRGLGKMRSRALDELPSEIRAFYQYRQARRTPFQRLGGFGPVLVIVILLLVLTYFFDAIR